jgi:hypothetical protein
MAGWSGILNGQEDFVVEHPITKKMVDSETVKGWMFPRRRLIPRGIESSLVPFEATSPAIFGLPEPTPESWIQYNDGGCSSIWNYLLSLCQRKNEKLVLLKIKLTDLDNPLVVDYASIRKTSKALAQIKDYEKYRKILAEGNRDYWNSRVKLKEYRGNFTLPEIVTFSSIPLERIEFLGERDKDLLVA